jgi:chemotaxis protein MotB
MGKKKGHEEEENLERWLLTYADLITLLMVFFIILYSMSNVDASKYEAMANSLKIALGNQPQGSGLVSQMMMGQKPGNDKQLNLQDKNVGKAMSTKQILEIKNPKEEQEFNKIVKEVKNYAKEKGLVGVEAKREARGVVINLSDKVLFESGKADLSLQARETLDALAIILFSTERQIKVEGHTDNVPINTPQFPSNWQLSTARATNVIMYWISKHPKSGNQLSAAGYGEYRPVASNATIYGRSKNRRVEIIILREILSVGEPGVNVGESTNTQKTVSDVDTETGASSGSAIDPATNKVVDYGDRIPADGN